MEPPTQKPTDNPESHSKFTEMSANILLSQHLIFPFMPLRVICFALPLFLPQRSLTEIENIFSVFFKVVEIAIKFWENSVEILTHPHNISSICVLITH